MAWRRAPLGQEMVSKVDVLDGAVMKKSKKHRTRAPASVFRFVYPHSLAPLTHVFRFVYSHSLVILSLFTLTLLGSLTLRLCGSVVTPSKDLFKICLLSL